MKTAISAALDATQAAVVLLVSSGAMARDNTSHKSSHKRRPTRSHVGTPGSTLRGRLGSKSP
jgi:hypothetical protein